MLIEALLIWNWSLPRRGVSYLVVLAIILGSGGCVDQGTDPGEGSLASLSMAAVFPRATMAQAPFVDRWRVEVVRPGEGVIARGSGAIGPTESTVTLEIRVALNGFCESLSVLVELSRGDQPWFRSHATHEICSGRGNEVQVAQLEWVRPSATVAPGSLSFRVQERHTANQDFSILYGGADGLEWSVSVVEAGLEWLSAQPSSGSLVGSQSATVNVGVDTEKLAPGLYSASIQVTGEGFAGPIAQIPVELAVTPGPQLGLSTDSVAFTVTEGFTPDPQVFLVTNPGGGTLTWSASDDVDWLELAPISGSLAAGGSQMVTVTADPAEVSVGQHQGVVTIAAGDAGDSPQTISVSLTKNPAPQIGLSLSGLTFNGVEGSTPPAQLVTISNVGGGTLNWAATDDVGWLNVQPRTGTLGAGLGERVTVSLNTTDLPAGYYAGTILFTDPGSTNSPLSIPVTLELAPQNSPPIISGMSWAQIKLNDPTCWNEGTRFEFYFTYSDTDGNILIEESTLSGTPIGIDWWFRPNGLSGSDTYTGEVDGNGFMGSVSFQLCIAYQVVQNTSIDVSITLRDSGDLLSNLLQVNVPRPDGANSPPPARAPVGIGVLPGR